MTKSTFDQINGVMDDRFKAIANKHLAKTERNIIASVHADGKTTRQYLTALREEDRKDHEQTHEQNARTHKENAKTHADIQQLREENALRAKEQAIRDEEKAIRDEKIMKSVKKVEKLLTEKEQGEDASAECKKILFVPDSPDSSPSPFKTDSKGTVIGVNDDSNVVEDLRRENKDLKDQIKAITLHDRRGLSEVPASATNQSERAQKAEIRFLEDKTKRRQQDGREKAMKTERYVPTPARPVRRSNRVKAAKK